MSDAAQPLLEMCHTRPDFLYTEARVVIYIDGPDHEQPDVKDKDVQITDCLMDEGYTIVRFGYRKDAWVGIGAQHRYLFGNDQL